MAKKKEVEKGNVVLETLAVEYVPHDSIKPNDYNPNRQSEHDFELLVRSIKDDGFTQPVIANRETRTIVDGEHRWRAAKVAGIDPIPVVFVDMTSAQAKIATLRHNRARGSEDANLAAMVLRDLAKLGATDMIRESLMMDDVEVTAFLDAMDDAEAMATEEIARLAEAPQDEIKAAVEREGGEVEEHQTASVQDVIRAREKRLKEAKTEADRQKINAEASVFRLRLVFESDEADVVKKALAPKPAQKLVEMMRAERERRKEAS